MLARFVPIVRTFAPIVAGVGKMRYRTFVTFNVIGALLWAVGVTTLGYFLGEIELVKDNIEIAIIAIVAVSLLPIVHRGHQAPPRGEGHGLRTSAVDVVESRELNRPTSRRGAPGGVR